MRADPVLRKRNRDDPRATRQALRRRDADDAVVAGRAPDRGSGFGRDPHGGEADVDGDTGAGAGSTGIARQVERVQDLSA
jgi:hypothetical protein